MVGTCDAMISADSGSDQALPCLCCVTVPHAVTPFAYVAMR